MFHQPQTEETSSSEHRQSTTCHDATAAIYNPQQRSRSIMDTGLEFKIYSKCPHNVRKCRCCHVTPLLDNEGKIVSYFLEHRARQGRMIECTIGSKNIRIRLEKRSKPEMADGDNNPSPSEPPQEVYVPDPIMVRMHSDMTIAVPPADEDLSKSTVESQMEIVQDNLRKQLPMKLVARSTRSIEGLILLFAGLQYDTSLEAIVIRCIQFLSAITDRGIVMSLKDTLMAYVARADVPNMPNWQSAADIFQAERAPNEPEGLTAEGFRIWETMRQGVFTKHLSYILGTVFAFSSCRIKNVNFSHPLYEKIAQHAQADSIDGLDLIDHSIKLYNWVSTVGMACIEARSFEPMHVNTTTLAKCHEKYYFWQHKFNEFRATGVSTMEERQLMYVEVDTIRLSLERFSKAQRDKYLTLQASSLHNQVIALFSEVQVFVCKRDRVNVAVGYHLAGIPKIGKSEITPKIHETICLARKVPYRKEDNAQVNLMAAFQDELNNATQTITINETMPLKEPYAKTLDVAYSTALALVDPVPFHPNRSSLEDKAKVTCTHISVISTGNTDQPFKHVAKTLGAWERRYPVIYMKMKEQFADDFGRLAPDKLDGSNDYHEFDMYEIVYDGGQKCIVHYVVDGKKSIGMNTREMLELVRNRAKQHFEDQDIAAKNHEAEATPGCLKCQRISGLCQCPKVDGKVMPITRGTMSVYSSLPSSAICENRTTVGDRHQKHLFECGECRFCGCAEPDDSPKENSSSSEEEVEIEGPQEWIRRRNRERAAAIAVIPEPVIEELDDFRDPEGWTRVRRRNGTFDMIPPPGYEVTGSPFPGEPEMLAPTTRMFFGPIMDLLWSSVVAWINPYFKLKWIWTIDNNLQRVLHEEIVEELSHWPDKIGCGAISLIPERWLIKPDGRPSMLGKLKLNFIELVAAEKQIFLPLPYLFRRALFFGVLFGMLLLPMMYVVEEVFELSPRKFEYVVPIQRAVRESGRRYLFPQFSEAVFQERDFYASVGIYTESYVDWKSFEIDLYFFQRALGKVWLPWIFTNSKTIFVLRQGELQWWFLPLCLTVFITITMFFYMWYRRWLGYDARRADLEKRCQADGQLQHALMENARRHCTEYNSLVPTAVGVIGAVATGLMIWNSIRNRPELDISRETKSTWNFLPTFMRQSAEPLGGRNSSSTEIINIVSKHVTRVETELDGKPRKITACYIDPGVLLIPAHFFRRNAWKNSDDPSQNDFVESLDLRLTTKGVRHKIRAYVSSMVKISGKDAFLLKVHKAPRRSESLAYLLPKETGTGYAKSNLLYLKPEGNAGTETISAKYEASIDCGGFSCGRGLSYVSKVTGPGFCGSPLIADRRDGAILGFHISGSARGFGSRMGYAQEITFEEYKRALDELQTHVDVMRQPEMKTIETRRFGINLIPNQGVHPKSKDFVEELMQDDPGFTILGHDPSLVRYKSRVKKSLLSDSIEKYCGQRNRWKAPHLKKPWVQHNAALEKVAEGAREVPPESLQWAVDDYWSDLQPILRKHIEANPDMCRPLTLEEAINGRPDAFYMGPFKMDTAAGIPGGNKKNSGLFKELEPYPDGRKKYELTPIAMDYYNKILEKFDNNELLGVWVRTCLKDEVVSEDSEKVRIFYIMECIFALICRQYFLPIVEFESRFPLTSECMVGVNCASKEWETMMGYIEELAVDGRLTDLDFSKYDLKRSTDVMCASLKLDVRMGEMMGFPQKVLDRMVCVCEELRSPIINWNGTIIWMYLWSSGNTMTVYGNSRENSLHQRISFHWNGVRKRGDEFYKLGKFRDNERIVNYGDDLISGSKPELRDLCDFHAKRDYFSSINMKITDARKSDNPQSTLPKEEVDFLKRKSVFHPELGCRVGALDQESIWKMGHMTASGEEPEDLALSAIQSMLSEAFLHGEQFYEDLRSKLSLCAAENKIWTDFLDRDFAFKVDEWKEKYDRPSLGCPES